jgi:hypothetical protein
MFDGDGDARLDPHDRVRVFLRPLGSVLPLGFLSFGVGALLTAALSLGCPRARGASCS